MPDLSQILTALAGLAAGAWVFLLAFRGGFWRARPRPRFDAAHAGRDWPEVVAVVPARNEASLIGACVRSLLAQDYAGAFRIIMVDDGSEDATAATARAAAGESGRLGIVRSAPLPSGWTGKMWALTQGVARAGEPAYLWLTDADIAHDPRELRHLVATAEEGNRDLVSLMVRLNCESFWERLLIPAFVFFFQMLFPFPWVNDRTERTAAAAGGSMLVRTQALKAAGSIAAIKDAVIDDCALARRLKKRGDIWLGLTEETHSLRRYDRLGEIWAMVARSAYAQLRYAPALLAATVAGLLAVFIVPVAAAGYGIAADAAAPAGLGLAAWVAMAAAYRPTLRLYGMAPWAGLSLPAAALLYCAMTVDSARRHYRGKGGGWKGRVYAPARGAAADDA